MHSAEGLLEILFDTGFRSAGRLDMHIGPYEITILETGRFALDGGAMFGSVPKEIWQRTYPADDRNRIQLAFRALLISSAARKILVDTGAGTLLSEKWRQIYQLDHNKDNLRRSLAQQGLDPEEITDVVLTHLHFDHAGGASEISGNSLSLAFPRATHYVQQSHWQWALKPSEKDRASFLPETLEPMRSSPRLRILEGPCELFPGVHLLISNGHTPGLQMVKIQDGSKVLFYGSDLIPTAAHLPLSCSMGYDLYPLTTLEEKRRYLRQACDEEWVVVLGHDPHSVAIRIQRGSKHFEVKETLSL